nr:hypothetical protein [Tanacetum cinerariifolium]GFA20704.1 hypothetical protein [Tanacetum cinerariifolium]
MMGEIEISTLTLEQYFRLIEENQALGMVNDEYRGMMEKDIEDMIISEYIEYEAEMKSDDDVDEWLVTDMEEHKKEETRKTSHPK